MEKKRKKMIKQNKYRSDVSYLKEPSVVCGLMDNGEKTRNLFEVRQPKTNMEYDARTRWRHITPQILAANVSLLLILHSGMNLSFPNLIIRHLGLEIGSWYGCIVTFAIPFGSIVSGILADKFGRKMTNFFTAVSCSFGWLVISLSQSNHLWFFYAASFSIGFSAGLTTASITYVSEISHKRYRSFFLSLVGIYYSLGILSTTALQPIMEWKQVALIFCGIFLLAAVLLVPCTPESPHWLITFRDDKIAARKSMRRLYSKEEVFQSEWNHLVESQNLTGTPEGRKLRLSDRIVYKPFCVLVSLMLLQQLSGIYLSTSFALKIFTEISPERGTKYGSEAFVIFGISRFCVSVLNSSLSARCGRKTLLMCSSFGMLLCCSLLVFAKSLTMYSTAMREIVSIFAFLAYIWMGCIGVGTIPWSLSAELLPTEVRGVGSTVTAACGLLLISLLSKLFPHLLEIIGITYVFVIFGLVSLAIIPFTWLFVPETYGKSLGDIERYFEK